MNPDHIHPTHPAGTNSWLAYVLAGLFLLGILVIFQIFPDQSPYTVVPIKGKGSVINWSKSYHFAFFPSGKTEKGALLAGKYDLLGFNDTYMRYQQRKDDTLRLSDAGDSMIFLNGKIHTLIIHKNGNLMPWFRQYQPEQLDQLESLLLYDTIPESYIPYLKAIARQHPQLSISFTENDSVNIVKDYLQKAGFFQPEILSIPLTDADIPLLAYWKQVRCLFIILTDSIIRNPLPALPTMNECIVFGDDTDSLPPDFFIHNPQLKKLSLLLNKTFYEVLTPLQQLDELVLNNNDSIPSPGSLKHIPKKLSVLILSGPFTGIERLAELRDLRWLGLPDNITQPVFNQLTGRLTKLQVLEIAGNDRLTDLHPLTELPDLRGLVIIDTVTDKKTIGQLKKLRYLSLPDDSKEDSAYLKEMQKALPGCIVVSNSGACLGSGWLLLLIPLSLVSGLLFHKKTTV